MRVSVSWGFATGVVVLLTLAGFFVAVSLFGRSFVNSTVLLLTTLVIGWLLLIVTAIIGAFLLGLLAGARIAAKSDFTPFEEAMLKMREEVREMRRHLTQHGRDGEKAGNGKGREEEGRTAEDSVTSAAAPKGPKG